MNSHDIIITILTTVCLIQDSVSTHRSTSLYYCFVCCVSLKGVCYSLTETKAQATFITRNCEFFYVTAKAKIIQLVRKSCFLITGSQSVHCFFTHMIFFASSKSSRFGVLLEEKQNLGFKLLTRKFSIPGAAPCSGFVQADNSYKARQ